MGVFNYFLNHWKRILTFIIFVILIILFFIAFAEILPINNNIQVIKFFGITLQNWGTILAIFGTIFTLVWAMFQYDKQLARTQQEKAYDVAKVFSEELIIKTNIVGAVLESYEPLKEIYSKIDFEKLKRFDIYEIIDISKDEKIIDRFNEIYLSDDLNTYFHNFVKEKFPEIKISNKNEFSTYVIETMNKLETVSINISSYASGVDYLYPSLHQVLLPFIQQICMNIARINGNYTYKYYINLIEVYNTWKKLRDKELKKEKREHSNYSKLVIKYNRKVEKYQNKLDKLKSKSLEKKPRKI